MSTAEPRPSDQQRVAVLKSESADAVLSASAAELSRSLQLPLLSPSQLLASEFDFYLCFEAEGLSLYSTANKAPGAVRVDFTATRLKLRAADSLKHQNLLKAVGIKGNKRPEILDATAGLAKDAYLLARFGCQVTLLERSAVVCALVADGLARARQANSEVSSAAANMHLLQLDFMEYSAPGIAPEVVYLDPMFPAANKSARAKKDMYLLQQLLGSSEDESKLLERACEIASKRVVVKRARLSPGLSASKPDITFKGSSSRFDVYLLS